MFRGELPSLLEVVAPKDLGFARELASKFASGDVSVLGAAWAPSMGWNVDPQSGHRWAQEPPHRFSYRESSGADPKWSWEVNRLLFLLAPALAPSHAKSRESVERLVESWCDEDDPGRGIAWVSVIEVAIRSLVLTGIRSHGVLSTSVASKVDSVISLHLRWLLMFPSRFSSANNHRVAELAAILVIASYWKTSLSREEVARFEGELLEVMESLILADGTGAEQSPTYAGFAVELAQVAVLAGNWLSEDTRRGVQDLNQRAVRALSEFRDTSGRLIRYGDDDEGKVFSSLVADRDYLGYLGDLVGIELPAIEPGLRLFAAGGRSVLRAEDVAGSSTTVTFDHGPLGFGHIAAHGQADVLHFTLVINDQVWIADPGTYRYHGDPKWRKYFRSSAAHNGPTLDSLDSSVMVGDFNWDRRYRAVGSVVRASSSATETGVVAVHDGYLSRRGVEVERSVMRVARGKYEITDQAHGSTHGRLEVRLTLPSDCEVKADESKIVIRRPGAGVEVRLAAHNWDFPELVSPSEQRAWISPSFGKKDAAWAIVFAGDASVNAVRSIFVEIEPGERAE